MKSPINNVGIIDPEGIVKGWKKNVLINKAIKPADIIILKASHLLSLVKTIYKTKSNNKIIDNIIDALFKLQGGYALTVLTDKKLIGIRDPFGIRPLVLGKLNNSYILASETSAFDIIGAKFVREVENGEIVIIENGKNLFFIFFFHKAD